MVYVLLVLGLVILVVGAELLVRGAVSLAELARISPLVIGLTIVAFGTSAPELAVSSISGLKGESAIALGNVVGSNVFNVLLILGISAVIVPLTVSSQLVKLDVPIMVAASLGVAFAAISGSIGRGEGVVMGLAFLLYTAWLIRAGRREVERSDNEIGQASETPDAESPAELAVVLISPIRRIAINGGLLLGGLVLLVVGAKLLVDSATTIARDFGVSELMIGLTIVAAGTSLPELATSIVAAIKGQRDIAVGNVVGSNVFNLLVVLSSAAVLSKTGVPVPPSVLMFDLAFMVGAAILCWPIFTSDAVVSRWEGAMMLLLYFVYTGLLIADALPSSGTEGNWVDAGKTGLVFIALPIVIASTVGIMWQRRHRGPSMTSPIQQ